MRSGGLGGGGDEGGLLSGVLPDEDAAREMSEAGEQPEPQPDSITASSIPQET